MNIIVIPHLPSAGRAYSIAKYLAKGGNSVHLILWDMPYPISFTNMLNNFRNSWKYKQSKIEGLIIHKIRRFPFFFPLNKPLFKWQIRKIFIKYDIDMIVSEAYFNETEPPLELPIIYDMCDDHEAFQKIYGSGIYKLAFKILQIRKTIKNQIKKSMAVIAVSDNLVKYAKKFREDKIYKFTNGVEGWVIKQKYFVGEKHSLVYVTTFGKWSEIYTLLYTLKKLKTKYPDIKLVLIGDGTELSGAKETVNKLKLNKNVYFLGRLNNRKKLFEEINKYEVCLNISEKNRFRDSASPMKVFEYSALGKKIVSTNLNEVKKLKFPNTFFYEKDRNGKNLSYAIKTAFDTKIDVKKTRDLVKKYSWESIIKHLQLIMENNSYPR
ncbi:MAG: glycosyltransferase [Candidatus Microgenomates bacterium]|jgi:glycosyltransferase involved in cell wall biosynthesis